MRIAVDLDGVLYEWSKTARYMLRHYKGHSASGPMGMESLSWDYIEKHVGKQDWDWLWNEGVDLGLFRYGHVVTGGQSAIRDMRTAGNTVVVATHRPSAAVPDTIAWLDLFQKPEAGVVFDGIHILTNGEPKHTVQADLLIDDKFSNLEDWVGHGRRGILFDREWNQGAKPAGTERAYGWNDCTRIIREMTWPKVPVAV
jgi:5'(3')-deoxyribonucleotidase